MTHSRQSAPGRFPNAQKDRNQGAWLTGRFHQEQLGGFWAGSGLSASDAIVAKADLHLAHGYDQSECGSPIMTYLHGLGTLNSVRASFILGCDRFLLIAWVCRTPKTVVSIELLI